MEITKLSEYTSFVEELPKEFSLSRGQSRDYSLLPTALRKEDKTDKRKFTKRAVKSFLNQFKINSYQYMPSPWDVKNDIEWMLYAQHFGLPTKLMDFTTSHITSLLFAVENSFQKGGDHNAVVYFLNPRALNSKNTDHKEIINVSYLPDSFMGDYDGPVVIEGRKNNLRINAQKGLFVLFQDDDDPLNEIDDEDILRKVVISSDSTKSILSSLFSMGISFSHIYPELSSVSRDILLQQDINDYLREVE